MALETHKSVRRRRQSVSLFSFLFPSFFPSAFDLEAPLTLEGVCARLEKLPRVRISRSVASSGALMSFLAGEEHPTSISVAPIDLALAYRDDDTYLYRADLHDVRYRVSVVGYLKRWEANSTVLTGRVYFDLHYAGLFLKSLWYTLAIGAVSLVVTYVLLFWGFRFFPLLMNNPVIYAALWLVVLAALWLNDVIVPAHRGRERLVTRLGDMLLLGDLADG